MQLHHTGSWRRWTHDNCGFDAEHAEGVHANELKIRSF